MRLCEFLGAKIKLEMIQGEDADGILDHGGFATSSRTRYKHNLSSLQCVKHPVAGIHQSDLYASVDYGATWTDLTPTLGIAFSKVRCPRHLGN